MGTHTPESLKEYKNPISFWFGENEPYPKKSAELLKRYLPQMRVCVFKGMGHGQMLHEHPAAYAEQIINELSDGRVSL